MEENQTDLLANPIEKIPNSQKNFEKAEQKWKKHTSWCQTLLQSYSNQYSKLLAQNKHEYHGKITEKPEVNPHLHGQLIYDKEGKNGKDGLIFWYWENWTDTCKRVKWDYSNHV